MRYLRPRCRPSSGVRQLADAIQKAAATALRLLRVERFQRLVPLDPDCFITPPDPSPDFTAIEVSMFEGRNSETQ